MSKAMESKAMEAKANLMAAQAALDTATDPEAKTIATRALLRAYLIDGYFREQMGTVFVADMVCECGKRKSYSYTCAKCSLYRHALYGGEHWVNTGFCNSTQC